mmetsp:Transcript_31158/g.45851  ORF Transcript_31158/g.45851 Transcript_31158/m.45851 type:complete len:196 (-) Transcript_31158:133-720(-)
MAKMTPLPTNKYLLLLSIVIGHSLLGGYYAGTRPEGAGWRFFSWHPFLMMVGMVGLMGTATLTKKRMGYTNTKLHGMIAWAGLMSSYAGFYVIYQNKNTMGKDHYTTLHSKAGLAVLVGSTMLGMAGGVFLHPDFGIDKQNGLIRTGHKFASRGMLGLAWLATLSGLQTLIGEDDVEGLLFFAAPLVLAAPFTLL